MEENKYIDLLCDFGFRRTFGKVEDLVGNLSQDEWAEYNATLKQARDYYATISYARNEGWKEGEAKGRARAEQAQ